MRKDKPMTETVKATLSKKGCALMAAMESDICRRTVDGSNEFDYGAFEKFWSFYLENLVKKQEKDLDYIVEVLNKQRDERAQKYLTYLEFVLVFTVSYVLGSLLLHFFGL